MRITTYETATIADVSFLDAKASAIHMNTIGMAVMALTRQSMRAIEVCRCGGIARQQFSQCNMHVHMLELWSVYQWRHKLSMLVPCKKHPCNSMINATLWSEASSLQSYKEKEGEKESTQT
jgi:hypothetical protein